MDYSTKKKTILSSIAVISILIIFIACIIFVFAVYDQTLFTSEKTQKEKAEAYASQASSTPKNGIVFLGDSIIEMYNLDKFFPNKNYINRGISSNESGHILKRLQSNVIDIAPKIIILHVGANDIGHKVPIDDYLKNVNDIIDKISQSLPDSYILVDSIFPTVKLNSINSKNLTKRRDNATISNVNDKLKNLCRTKSQTCKVKYLDMTKLLAKNNELNRDYTLDGLHLNEKGYKIVSREYTNQINTILGQK